MSAVPVQCRVAVETLRVKANDQQCSAKIKGKNEIMRSWGNT